MNAQVSIARIEFIIQPELTICNLFYVSNEPGTPWGGGWKTKTFPKETSAIDIMQKEVWVSEDNNYLMWSDGREGVDEPNGGVVTQL